MSYQKVKHFRNVSSTSHEDGEIGGDVDVVLKRLLDKEKISLVVFDPGGYLFVK